MAPDLDEGGPALRYRAMLAFASTVSLASIVITFLVWLPKQDRPLGALVLLPVFIPYPLCVDVWASMAGGYEPV